MLPLRNIGYVCIACIAVVSCEEVIEIDLPKEEPRLIVEALIRADLSQTETQVSVKLSLTDGFFGTVPLTKTDNIYILTDKIEDNGFIIDSGIIGFPSDESNLGVYETTIATTSFEDNILYTLFINHEGRLYAAQTSFTPAPPIDSITQGTNTLFDEDETEVIVTFKDIAEQDNFYIFDFGFEEFLPIEDQFYKDQEYSFSYFYKKQLAPGNQIEVSILGADRGFYNYMDLLIEQSEGTFELFETPAATVRGNVFDITDLDNIDVVDNVERPELFPLGYFAIVQEHKISLTIE